MYCPGCGVGIPNSHEVFTVSVADHRNRTFRVIADQTVVDPVLIHRPRMNLRKAVGGCKPHGISDARIIPRRYPGIVPPSRSDAVHRYDYSGLHAAPAGSISGAE